IEKILDPQNNHLAHSNTHYLSHYNNNCNTSQNINDHHPDNTTNNTNNDNNENHAEQPYITEGSVHESKNSLINLMHKNRHS
ncbi:hypothetical protein AAHH79_36875, partial [Burkholderia pseudomallei]